MNKETKITIGVKVTPDYVKEVDSIVEFFQSRIDMGKVTRSEVLLKALDAFAESVTSNTEYQCFLEQKG